MSERRRFSVFSLFFCGILTLLMGISFLLPLCMDWDTDAAGKQFSSLSYASVGHKTRILSIFDAESGQLLEEHSVYKIIDSGAKSITFIDDLSARFRTEGWQKERTRVFPHEIRTTEEGKIYVLGADGYGRDLMIRLTLGMRLSFLVGVGSMVISLFLGIFFGSAAVLFPSWVDTLVLFIINSLWSLPTIILVFLILLVSGPRLSNVIIALSLTLWIEIARMVRGELRKIYDLSFVQYARLQGSGKLRILFKHMLPNIWSPLLVLCIFNFSLAILLEAGLSFLGFGVRPPLPSLGNILSENYALVISGYYVSAFLPAFIILLLVFTFNILGNQLRDMVDVKL